MIMQTATRWIVPLLIASALGCTVDGCAGGKPGPAAEEAGVVTLTYWPAPNPQEIQLADSLVRMWNRLHPDIHVIMQPIPVSQSTEEVLLAAIAGKTTPDICSNIWPGALHDYTQAGGLIDLSSFADFDSVASSRTPHDLLETFATKGHHFYQMPWKSNPVMMFYNKRLFAEAGVDTVPRTYSEYFAAGRKVARDTNGDGEIDVWMGERDIRPIWWQRLFDFFPFYIAASDGKTLFHDGAIDFGDSAAAKVFGFFQTCYGDHFFPRTFFQGNDPFALQMKATHFAGPWEVAFLTKFAPNLKFGVAPLPVPDDHVGPVCTYGDYKNISIFSSTKHPKEAWEFVKFLIAPEHDLLLLEIANQLPVRGDLLTNPRFHRYFAQNPEMVKFADAVPHTRGPDAAPDLKEILDGISQVYEECCVYGRIAPPEAVTEAVRRTRLIVEWNR